jgi:diacylglycerol kinase (ATP)
MAKDARFSIGNRVKAFGNSVAGLLHVFRSEHAMWFHLCVAGLLVLASIYLQISAADWRWVVLAITLVWGAETMNTAVELVCDALHPDQHPLVGKAKDVAAGAVLVAALGSAVILSLVFWPYLLG